MLDGIQRRLRREACVQGDRGAQLQRRRGLDVEPADMEQRQHGEDMILRRHVVHVLAHGGVRHQRVLAQYRALGMAGRARGVDDEQGAGCIDVVTAAVAAPTATLQQSGKRGTASWRKIEADDAHARQCRRKRFDDRRKSLLHHQCFHACIAQDEQLLRHRETPVDRHQHRAEPGAGVEQDKIVGVIGGQDRDAVAPDDAKLGFQRPRGLADALCQRRVGQFRCRQSGSPPCPVQGRRCGR